MLFLLVLGFMHVCVYLFTGILEPDDSYELCRTDTLASTDLQR